MKTPQTHLLLKNISTYSLAFVIAFSIIHIFIIKYTNTPVDHSLAFLSVMFIILYPFFIISSIYAARSNYTKKESLFRARKIFLSKESHTIAGKAAVATIALYIILAFGVQGLLSREHIYLSFCLIILGTLLSIFFSVRIHKSIQQIGADEESGNGTIPAPEKRNDSLP